MQRCRECGFEYDLDPDRVAASGAAIIRGVEDLADLLSGGEPSLCLSARPSAGTWSPIEYACHVRDVLLVQRERVLLARRTERPQVQPMGRDERVEHDGYSEQHELEVARQLGDAARLFDRVLGRLEPADWQRTIRYPYPAAMERSLAWVAVHTWHEVLHHLGDVRRQLPVGHPGGRLSADCRQWG